MNKISNWIIKFSSTWLMIASLILMVFFLVSVLPAQAAKSTQDSGSDQSPDTSFFYTPNDLYQMAEDYGVEGRQAYVHARWTFDLVFPLVYTVFLAVGISWFILRLTGWGGIWKLANLLPILGGIFDLLENTATTLAMLRFPAKPQFILASASLLTPIKWVLVSLGFLTYLVMGAAWLIQRIQAKKS